MRMFMNNIFLKMLAVACLFIGFTACHLFIGEPRVFIDKNETIKHFQKNRLLFQQAVNRIEYNEGLLSFGFRHWDINNIYWNDFLLKPSGNKYEISVNNKVLAKNKSFDEVAKLAGTTAVELSWWINIANKLQITDISIMGTSRPAEEQYVEICLKGSKYSSYGFIYIPEGHLSVLYPDSNVDDDPGYPYTYIYRIKGRWFYFEGEGWG